MYGSCGQRWNLNCMMDINLSGSCCTNLDGVVRKSSNEVSFQNASTISFYSEMHFEVIIQESF